MKIRNHIGINKIKSFMASMAIGIYLTTSLVPMQAFAAWDTQLNKGDMLTPTVWNDFIVKMGSLINENLTLNTKILSVSGSVDAGNTSIANINATLLSINSGFTNYSNYLATASSTLNSINTKLTSLSGSTLSYVNGGYLASFLKFSGGSFTGKLSGPKFELTSLSGGLSGSGGRFITYGSDTGKISYSDSISSDTSIVTVGNGGLTTTKPLKFTNGVTSEGGIGNGTAFAENTIGLSLFGINSGLKIRSSIIGGDAIVSGDITSTGTLVTDSDSVGNDKITFNGKPNSWIKASKNGGDGFGLSISAGGDTNETFSINDGTTNKLLEVSGNGSKTVIGKTTTSRLSVDGDSNSSKLSFKYAQGADQQALEIGANSTDSSRFGYLALAYSITGKGNGIFYPIKFKSNLNGSLTSVNSVELPGTMVVESGYNTYVSGATILSGATVFPKKGVEPSGLNGQIYYNSSTDKFRCYEGGSWKDCGGSSVNTGSLVAYSGDFKNKNVYFSNTGSLCFGSSCTGNYGVFDGSSANTPGVSCMQIKKSYPDRNSGSYWINPSKNSTSSAYQVYCDMSALGGGWTLAMKMDGSKTTFAYDSVLWKDPNSLLNDSDATAAKTEYKGRAYNDLPVDEVMLVFDNAGTKKIAKLAFPGVLSSYELFNGPTKNTSLGRDAWKGLVTSSSMQTNCNIEGTNITYNNFNRVRLGLQSNNEANCRSNDSRLGIGMNAPVTAGNYARGSADNGDKDLPVFAYLYVRSSPPALANDGSVVSNPAKSCNDLNTKYPGTPSGEYRIKPNSDPAFKTYCDMSTDGGGWSLAIGINRDTATWDAYNTDMGSYAAGNTRFGYKVSRFTNEANGEDLEYMIQVDGVQKGKIYKGVNKLWLSPTYGTTVFDTYFFSKNAGGDYTPCAAGLFHGDSYRNWAIASADVGCAGRNAAGGLLVRGNTDMATTIYGLGAYNASAAWTNYKIYVREPLGRPADGTSATNYATSCRQLRIQYPTSTSGEYRIKPNSDPAFKAYCDMTTDGGGWTLTTVLYKNAPLWNAYTTDNGTYNLFGSYGNKISRFSSDANGEDLEYMFTVDEVQKGRIYKDINKSWADTSTGNTIYDNNFYYRGVGGTRATCGPTAGLIHNDVYWNWSLASATAAGCSGYSATGRGLMVRGTSEQGQQLYGLGTYSATTTWGYLKVYVREPDISLSNDGSSSLNYATTCNTLKTQYPFKKTDEYWIKPTGAPAPIKAFCDMTTDGGGYTFYAVTAGLQTYRYTDNDTCKVNGLQMFVPRTQAHLNKALYIGSSFIVGKSIGVYGLAAGNYTTVAMNSSTTAANNWKPVGDQSLSWFMRGTTYTEPSGDYTAGCWLGVLGSDANGLTFNDGNCTYGPTQYMCGGTDK